MLLESWELKENGLKREYDEVAGKVKFFAINPPPVIEAIASLQTESAGTRKSITSSLKPDFLERPYVLASTPDPQPTESDVQNVDAILPNGKPIKFTYTINQDDGSMATRNLKGIGVAKLKKLSKEDLSAIGISKKLVGGIWKFFPTEPSTLTP